MLNPEDISHNLSIRYNETEVAGQLSKMKKFDGIDSESMSFKILIDGTGVVAQETFVDVKTQVKTLLDIVYVYDGVKHEPNHVRILWGSFIFFGRMDSISFKYTLFKPSGEPLRAEADVKFSGFLTAEEEALRSNRSSPDLSHVVLVKAGDTLPALCDRIYSDPLVYRQVAEVNRLVDFRKLIPGTRLLFPPLR
ncbi:MAG: peptidoglycan-binding protein [Gammaproteobacteria bacterium]|nr:MAG: peptidoglycan-binding protein [Gammaproteobacteria bacterium]